MPAPGQAARHREDAGDRSNRRVERELADEGYPVEHQRLVLGAEERDGDREGERSNFPWLFDLNAASSSSLDGPQISR